MPYNKTEDFSELESPGHRFVATGYHVLGGATTEDSTIVLVRPCKITFSEWMGIREAHYFGLYYSDTANKAVFVADNLSPFRLSWNGNRNLIVHCSLDRLYQKKNSWNDVSIDYVEN